EGYACDWMSAPARQSVAAEITRLIYRAPVVIALGAIVIIAAASSLQATPANKAAVVKYYGQYLPTNLNSCTTCHLPAKLDHPPENLDEFPHNPFGKRLRALGQQLKREGKAKDLATRLALIAREDADGDGVPNEVELLLGHGPGDAKDKPSKQDLASLPMRQATFAKFLKLYRWEPFQPVKRPAIPKATAPLLSSLQTPARIDVSTPAPGKGASLFVAKKISAATSWSRN